MSDPEPIRRLIMAYPIHGDRGEAEQVAALFAPQGILEASGRRVAGPAAIQAWLADPAGASSAARPLFVRHHVTSSLIEFAGDSQASARSYLIVFTDLGIDHAGVYVDRFVLVDGAWKIAHRKVLIDWVRPDSTYFDRLAPTIPERLRPRPGPA